MSYLKAAPRIPDDDPVNVALLGMGFERETPTPTLEKPVNRWSMKRLAGEIIIKPNVRAKYVVVLRVFVSKSQQDIYERVPDVVYDDPLTLAAALTLEGDGDPVLGAFCIKYGRSAG